MTKLETYLGYFTFLGCITVFCLTSLHFYYLEMLNVAVSPSTVFGAGVFLTFALIYTAYLVKVKGNYAQRDYETTIKQQQKQLRFLLVVVIPSLKREIKNFQSIIGIYEQTIVQYKDIVSSFSTKLAIGIISQLEQAIVLLNGSKSAIFQLKHNIQNTLSSNNSLLKLTKIQQSIIDNLPKLDGAKKVSKAKVSSFQITKDYHNIFDSIQKAIMPRHSFKDVLGVLQSTYPETSPFEGEQYRFYFGDKVIKERIGHAYKGEIKLSTLEKEFSIYRKSKK